MAQMYSGGKVKCEILDATHDRSNFRSEWKLDRRDNGYLSNMRLVNVGVEGAGGANYNILCGVMGVIKRIRLMDGKTELCSLREANRWLGFKNLLHPNSVNESVSQDVLKNKIGYHQNSDLQIGQKLPAEPITADASTTPNGHIDLREVLPLLNKIEYLDTKTFPNLKLVVEYETNINNVVNNTANPVSTIQPDLIVDVVMDDGLASQMSSESSGVIVWNEIEHDEYILPASVAVQPPINHRINGFNNKNLERMVIVKTNLNPADDVNANAVRGAGNMGSISNVDEKINVNVNGKSTFTYNGVEGDNSRLALMNDTWGEMNVFVGANKENLRNVDNLVEDGVNLKGTYDYFGCYIGEEIKDLQISHGRKGIPNGGNPLNANNDQRVHIYGEITKSLVIKGGEYVVSYVV